jgi:UDP-N-acetylmuramoylalanine--D-glutamate ligase
MRKVAVIGLGVSGQAAVKVLSADGWLIDCYDDRKEGMLPLSAYKDEYEFTVLSPGINPGRLPVKPSVLTSEIELGRKLMKPSDKLLAVTGTNGKSTVTHLTAQILNKTGVKAVACGNIGYPLAQAVLERAKVTEPIVYVVELSSFQTELLSRFQAQAAAITNITPDHLDRYGSMEAYAAAKMNIFNYIDVTGELIATHSQYLIVDGQYFKTRWVDEKLKQWPSMKEYRMSFGAYSVDTRLFPLIGDHNLVNLAFALALANAIVPLKGDVTDLIDGLTGMPHRMEKVAEHEDVIWINDSKATNVQSTLMALKSCNYPCVVLLGGRDKKGDYTELLPELKRCASEIILFGEAAKVICSQIEGKIEAPIIISRTLKQAVKKAKDIAMPGYTVILTPGGSSFDEFENFEDRGLKFAGYIEEVYK